MTKGELVAALEQWDDDAQVVLEFADYNPEESEYEYVQMPIADVRCVSTGYKIILSVE